MFKTLMTAAMTAFVLFSSTATAQMTVFVDYFGSVDVLHDATVVDYNHPEVIWASPNGDDHGVNPRDLSVARVEVKVSDYDDLPFQGAAQNGTRKGYLIELIDGTVIHIFAYEWQVGSDGLWFFTDVDAYGNYTQTFIDGNTSTMLN